MSFPADQQVRSLQEVLRDEVDAAWQRYQVLKTSEAKVEYLLALKKLSEMSCWRIGG